jgi:hypothetical protein
MGLRRIFHLLLIPFLLLHLPVPSAAYSVFTHELLIDLAWKDSLVPLLQARFPGITDAELQLAHSYAYGGCAIQDLGYYPLNKEFFSDLAHYVRSGDFVSTLLRDARDANEYSFALGAMAHYFGDNIGHHEGINRATAINFPNLERKYGPSVTYDESPHAHVRTEFAFDIDQLSKAHLAPRRYLGAVGLRVPTRLLSHTFSEVYSLPLSKVDGRGKFIVLTYRFAVRGFLPRIAYAQTLLHRGSFPPDIADTSTQTFLDSLHQAGFESTWNAYRRSPRFSTHLVAFIILIIPKIGLLSELAIKVPTPETKGVYIASVNHAFAAYRAAVKQLMPSVGSQPSQILPNRDLDTGERTKPGTYALTDETYAQLLRAVTAKSQRSIEAGLQKDILAFYSDPSAPVVTKKDPKEWARVQENLRKLRNLPLTRNSAVAVE